MKKLLLPIFGGILLTTTTALTTGQNVDTAIKVEEIKKTQNQEMVDSLHNISNLKNLNESEIKVFQIVSQTWDDNLIDSILNKALIMHNNQLLIDQTKLNINELPKQLSENFDLIVANLNNAVTFGLIKVNVIDNKIELLYSENSINDSNKNIVSFNGNSSVSTFSPSVWYTTYGPSRWWKFWEWGGIIHLNNEAVNIANSINKILGWISFAFLFSNIGRISNAISNVRYADKIGNAVKLKAAEDQLSRLLGDMSLDILGSTSEIIAIIGGIVGVLTALSTLGIVIAFAQLFISIFMIVLKTMVNVNVGNGAKWYWPTYIIPGGIYAE